MRCAGYHENMIGRTYFDGDQVTQFNLVLYSTIKWPVLVRPALMYGAETWAVKKTQEKDLDVAKIRMLR